MSLCCADELSPRVITVTPSAARASLLRRVTETVGDAVYGRERENGAMPFLFAPLADVVGPAGPLGTIWHQAGTKELRPILRDVDVEKAS